MAIDRGTPGGARPSHGTTGTMVNPALDVPHKQKCFSV